MSMQQIIDTVRSFEGALVVEPREGDGTPPLAWGDAFFYYAPDGEIPANTQPYGTIVTKDYPEDTLSRLGDGTGTAPRWRVNVHVGRAAAPDERGDVFHQRVGWRHVEPDGVGAVGAAAAQHDDAVGRVEADEIGDRGDDVGGRSKSQCGSHAHGACRTAYSPGYPPGVICG